MEAKINPSQQGEQIILALKNPQSLVMSVINKREKIALTDENGEKVAYDSFVVFPKELSQIFPSSYLSPQRFLRELNITEPVEEIAKALTGKRVGTMKDPVFQHREKEFELTVLRGLSNEEVLSLAELARQGFEDASVRAQYQAAMHNILQPFITKEEGQNYSIRIFDDCLGTGDSVAGYLSTRLENPEALSKGVEVTVTVATLQSILFLKAFAKAHNFSLKINAGFIATGLSAGKKKGEVRKHANYIVFPDEFLKKLDDPIKRQLESYRDNDGNIYVVGDMGEAARGISEDQISDIRNNLSDREVKDWFNYCQWNGLREDPHGDHLNRKKKLTVFPYRKGLAEDVYLARGGYLPYIWDQEENPNFLNTNKTVVSAGRKWTKEKGFGLAIKNLN